MAQTRYPNLISRHRVLFTVLPVLLLAPLLGFAIEPDEPMNYRPLAFYPDRWENRGVDTTLHPWEGEHVVFFTTTDDLDGEVMERFVERLDAGWATYEEIVGRSPRTRNLWNDKPTIAAVPDSGLTCGVGCGYVGATGIEVGAFYNHDYRMVSDNPDAFPHYYFYEMGRNYFVFGHKHSAFTTGFAVFMRYVCMDAVGCEDPEARLRTRIERVEALYAESEMSFLDAFTNAGALTEKQPRLPNVRGPSDQPCVYASAMLKLRADYGGDEFLIRFYRQLDTCPRHRPNSAEGALLQSVSWLVAASCAAGQDLAPVFVGRWRMPLSEETCEALAAIDWEAPGITAGEVLDNTEIEFR